MALNVFELFAKLGFDSGDFDKGVDAAAAGFDGLGDAAAGVSGDTAKAEKAIDKLASAVSEATDDTHGMSDAAQANAAKVKVLGAGHEKAKAKVAALQKELNKSVKETGTASDETRELADKLAKAEKECDDYAKALKDVQDALDGAGKGTKSLTEQIAGGVLKGNIMTSVVSGLWDGVKQFAASIWNMDEATEEYRVAQGKLNTAFETAGYSAQTAQSVYSDFYAILGDTDTAAEASQLLARLATNTEDMSRWTEIAAGVNGTFGDSLPIEGLIEASNETAKVGTVTGVLADALNWVGISEDDFNARLAQCADTEERTALITDTLATAYSAAAANFKANNATVIQAREAHLRLQEAQAKVGEQSSRLKTALSSALAPAMEALYGWTEKLVEGCANWAEGWAAAVHASDVPIDVTTVEEAKAKIEELNAELDRLRGEGYSEVNSSTFKMLQSEVGNLNDFVAEHTELQNADADATRNAADASDKMTVSANGFTVELTNSNMTLEEATQRLNDYTSAATNMFSQINTESELTYQDMLGNLQHNIEATEQFGDNMTQIVGVLPAELADMFASGGPEMYAGIVAMLAEANAGADVGLTQLNELYEQAGKAGVEAFLEASTGMPVDMETPATKMAEAMDNDVSCEQAGQNVVDRTATAVQAAVSTGGFDTAGGDAMRRFADGIAKNAGLATQAAQNVVNDVVTIINAGLANVGTQTAGHYGAGGLDYVPYNGYPAILHRGEAVLTAVEADDWRRGEAPGTRNAAGVTIIQNIQSVPQTPVELAAATAAYFEMARWAI